MTRQPAAGQPAHRSGALLDHLARRMRLRAGSVLAPLGLRPRHLVALTVLRGRDGITQQALSITLEMDGTNIVGLLNELEAEDLIERRRSPRIVAATSSCSPKPARSDSRRPSAHSRRLTTRCSERSMTASARCSTTCSCRRPEAAT